MKKKFWDRMPFWLFYLCHFRKIRRARKFIHSEIGNEFMNQLRNYLRKEGKS